MTYECFERFVSSVRVLYNPGHLIGQDEYDRLTTDERKHFREWDRKPFDQSQIKDEEWK